MEKNHAAITAVGGYIPDYILTNEELETMVETSDEWIITRTGIKERHILKDKELGSAHLGARAVKNLLESKDIDPNSIDLLICATATPDMQFPATANLIADECGLKKSFSFDISAACSGFLFAINTGAQFVEAGRCKRVIVVGADKMSSIVDYQDRKNCIIFGDGAGAVLLEENNEGNGIINSILHADGSGCVYLHQKAGGSRRPASIETVMAKEHYIYQDGKTVFKFAVKNMADVCAEILEKNGLTGDDINWLVPHQANYRIIKAAAERMNLPTEKVMLNIQKLGNTTNGTIPLCLWEWQNKLKKGDKLILTAFGGGFTWGATYVRWAY